MQPFTMYTDPGHGWLKVPTALLHDLGIADRITQYSFQRGTFSYLEEDCDFATFMLAYRDRYGCEPILLEMSTNHSSRIRSYASYVRPTAQVR